MRILKNIAAASAAALAVWPTATNADIPFGDAGYTWVGDFNADGRADMASAIGNDVIVYLSTGVDFQQQTWSARPPVLPNKWGSTGYSWAGDFNGDGKTDIASASGEDVFVHLSTGAGFDSDDWSVEGNWGGSDYTWTGDFNGDGKTDIASADGARVYVNLSNGKGFDSYTWPVDGKWGGSDYTWVGDFDGDGKADIASADGANVHVKLSNGTGFTSLTWKVSDSWGSAGYTWTGDFNGDGKTDIASASGKEVYMSLSNGAGFDPNTWVVADAWGAAKWSWVGDFNADGLTDIASADSELVFVRYSTGTKFNTAVWSGPDTWHSAAFTRIGDFDGDGNADIVSADKAKNFQMRLSLGRRAVNATWYAYQYRSCSLPGLVAARAPSNPIGFPCKTTPINAWMAQWDKDQHLSWTLTNEQLGFMAQIKPGTIITPDMDGLYIFVLDERGALWIRRSDRPKDSGEYGVVGDPKKYGCGDNPPGDGMAHMFVRHSQLAHGRPVFSSGQLQIYNAKIIWISNASGHYRPDFVTLEYVQDVLDGWNIPRAYGPNFMRKEGWDKTGLPKDEL